MTDQKAEPMKPRIYRRGSAQREPGLRPIVLDYHRRADDEVDEVVEEDNERYSKGLADVQQAERDLVRVLQRATRAVSQGVDTYDRERRRSAKEKTDGAIEDFPHNTAKAVSESLKEASEIPLDIADALTTRSYRKRLRRSLKDASRAMRVFRL